MTADQPSPFLPKLRFPEFRDAADWEEVSLGTLLVRAPDYGVNDAAVPFSATLPTYIRITDINDDGQFAARARVSVDIDATDEQYLEEGDIVLARTGASVGKSYRYRGKDGRLVYAGFLIRVRPNPERLLSRFLAAYLSTWSYWDWVRRTSARSGQPGINATEYASIPLPLPPDRRTLAEQQKIADCLGSLDDLIAADGRQLEALRQHKQGLMQQLFPQAGETVPRLRFPEFEGAGDWEQKRLSSLVKLVSGVHLAPDMYSTTGEVPYFTGPSDFTDAIQCIAKWTAESVNIAKQHDTLITVKGSGVGEIWYLTLPSIAMGRQLMAVRTEVGDRRFIYQFLSTQGAQFKALASGNLIPGLSRGDILGMAAYFPSRDEQKKIADCLGPLDDLIVAEGRRVDALRQHKRGLTQQLFASLEAESR